MRRLTKKEIEEHIKIYRKIGWVAIGLCLSLASIFILTGLQLLGTSKFSQNERLFCLFMAAVFIVLAIGIHFTGKDEIREMRRTHRVKRVDIGPIPES